jgi:hypothetical protein
MNMKEFAYLYLCSSVWVYFNLTYPCMIYVANTFMICLPYKFRRQFAPVWQTYPMASEDFTAFNWDWLSDTDTDAFIHSVDTVRAILGEPYMLPDP